MKSIILPLLCLICFSLQAQQTEQRSLKTYEKLVIHPYVDIELDQGDEPKAFVVAQNWDTEDVLIEQKGKELHIFLRGAKTNQLNKMGNHWKKYGKTQVKVILTYQELKKISMRGDGELTCLGPIEQDRFSLTLMGDCKATFAHWEVNKLNASLMGDSDLDLGSGVARTQVWSIFGDCSLEASELKGKQCRIRSFGDSDIRVYSTQSLHYKIFGESRIAYRGNPVIKASLALGEKTLKKID